MTDEAIGLAAQYVRDGHRVEDVAERFSVDIEQLRHVVEDRAVSHTSNGPFNPVLEPDIDVTRTSNTSNGSNADREKPDPDLLAGLHAGDWLDAQTFPPLTYAVPGVVPEGFSLLVGAPKAGKSWAALGMLLAVASGGRALGKLHVGTPRRVLYLALEDGDRRMQDRCRTLLSQPYRLDDPIPELFCYLTRVVPGMAAPTIEQFVTTYPDTALVVVDTLGRVLPPASPAETIYQRDYRVGSRLKQIADDRPGLAIQAVHHDRKADSDDFVDRISGTNGFGGAADTIVVLNRKRQSVDGSLMVTGRDVPENEYAITMSDAGTWTLAGVDLEDAAKAASQRAESSSGLSDLSVQVLDFVRDGGPKGRARKEITQAYGSTVDMYIKRLVDSGRLVRYGRGRYRDPSTHAPPLELLEPLEMQVNDGTDSSNIELEALETDGDDDRQQLPLETYLKQQPGRCGGCGMHIRTQGHDASCPERDTRESRGAARRGTDVPGGAANQRSSQAESKPDEEIEGQMSLVDLGGDKGHAEMSTEPDRTERGVSRHDND